MFWPIGAHNNNIKNSKQDVWREDFCLSPWSLKF